MNETTFLRRPSFLPKKKSEYPLFIFISLVIPLTYWFEIFVVLPYHFENYPLLYWLGFILGHFILFNIVGNFLGILMYDTSIRGRKMPSENDPDALYCNICQSPTPPRSYHCPSCDICILKRDHHCIFTSCCIGFYNHRFFIIFVYYLMIATVISLPFNMNFLYREVSIIELNFLPALIIPALLLFFDLGSDSIEAKHAYLLVSVIGFVGVAFCSVWFYFHLKLVLKGAIVHEMRKCINVYDLGADKNLEMVFGKRWLLVWISPFVQSPLPCDGIKFPVAERKKVD